MIDPYEFAETLTTLLDEDAVVVAANGTACLSLFHSGIVKKGQRYIWNSGCASMGYALPAAIGACFSSGKPVICVEGDGSIMMNIQELQTIQHHSLPVKVFILNNHGYHSIQETQDNYFGSNYIGSTLKDISFPNFENISYAFKLLYYKLYNLEYDINVLRSVLENQRPLICEVMLDDYKFKKQKF